MSRQCPPPTVAGRAETLDSVVRQHWAHADSRPDARPSGPPELHPQPAGGPGALVCPSHPAPATFPAAWPPGALGWSWVDSKPSSATHLGGLGEWQGLWSCEAGAAVGRRGHCLEPHCPLHPVLTAQPWWVWPLPVSPALPHGHLGPWCHAHTGVEVLEAASAARAVRRGSLLGSASGACGVHVVARPS